MDLVSFSFSFRWLIVLLLFLYFWWSGRREADALRPTARGATAVGRRQVLDAEKSNVFLDSLKSITQFDAFFFYERVLLRDFTWCETILFDSARDLSFYSRSWGSSSSRAFPTISFEDVLSFSFFSMKPRLMGGGPLLDWTFWNSISEIFIHLLVNQVGGIFHAEKLPFRMILLI